MAKGNQLTDARVWMEINAEEFRDKRTGNINMTHMAEQAVAELALPQELLDDGTSWIWDVALEVAVAKGGTD